MTTPGPRQGAVTLDTVTKSYGAVAAVRAVTLNIDEGETVALLGPNGAGKSTTLDMVLGLIAPDSGTVSLFGVTPGEAVAHGLVGGMLQTGSLIEYLSVSELVTLVASLYPHPLDVADVLHLTGTSEIATRSTKKLSGGQTQRVRAALALVANPELLVLDEPTAALDVESRRSFWAAMRAVAARGTTIIFATHYLDEADTYADRIVVMANGRVVADGSPEGVKATVGGRTIRATLVDVEVAELGDLSGVESAERHGDTVVLACRDPASSDAVLRELLRRYPEARDIEVRGAGLEEAFVNLTGETDASGAGERP